MKNKAMSKIMLAVIGLSTVAALTACNANKGQVLARVGSTKITSTQLEERIQQLPENIRPNFEKKENQGVILDQMINEELLFQEAKRLGYEKHEDYKKQVKDFENQLRNAKKQALINSVLRDNIDGKINVTDQEIVQFYDNNPSQFQSYEQRRAQHILVKTKAEAENILKDLKAGKSFDKLAQEQSIDPTGKNGGDLGFFRKGDLVPDFEKAVFGLENKGDTSGIVQTQFGFHIIRLTDVRTLPKRSLNEMKSQIQQVLYNQKRNSALNELMEKLKKTHKVSKTEEKK